MEKGVRVWFVRHNFAGVAEYLSECVALLCPAEREKYLRLRQPADQTAFLLSHRLLRTMLSHVAGLPAERWRFRYSANGRLELCMEDALPPLNFSLSHTREVSACLVTSGPAAGVDVENIHRPIDVLAMAARFFHHSEFQTLQQLTDARQRAERFMQLWTLKEAYLKARGTGFSRPADSCVFEITPNADVHARFSDVLEDDPGRWQFWTCDQPAGHVLSVAVQRTGPAPLALHLSEWSPL